MTLSGTIIDGNSFGPNSYTDGYSLFLYTYNSVIHLNADSVIVNNSIAGITTLISGDMLYIDNCNCTVANNKFIKENSIINSYINVTGVKDQIIVDNYFDGYNTGISTDENIVKGLIYTSTYLRNKNQTGYKAVQITPYMRSPFPYNTPVRIMTFIAGPQTIGPNLSSETIKAYEAFRLLDGYSRSVTFQLDLGTILPENVRITDIASSFLCVSVSNVNTVGTSSFRLRLNKTISNNINFTSPPANFPNTLLDVPNGTGTGMIPGYVTSNVYIANDSASVAALANTQYLYMNNLDGYVTTKNYDIYLRYDFSFQVINNALAIDFYTAPVIIKYRW